MSENDTADPIANLFEEIIQDLPGRILPKRYRIDRLLSANPFTAIYRTFNEQQETIVTLRVFRTLIKGEEDYQFRRFKQEIKKLSSLSHPNIAKTLDAGLLEEGLPYVVLEHVEGPTLEEVLVHQNRIEAVQVGTIFSQIARAVQAAHDHGVLHETLKPSRIIISETKDGDALVKTAGFGLLALHHKLGMPLSKPATKAQFIGTSAYMSPEQCFEGAEVDGRSDIYSIGCMMYEALSGQVPFLASNEMMMKMHLEMQATPIPVVRKDLKEFPKRLLAIIDKCMVKDQTQRYQFARDLESDIVRDADPTERDKKTVIPAAIQKAEQRVKESKEPPYKLIAAIMLGSLLVAGVGYLSYTLVSATSKIADNSIWQMKLDTGKRAIAEGKFEEAAESLKSAIAEAKKFPAPDARMAVSLNEMAAFHIINGRYSTAITALKDAATLEDKVPKQEEDCAARTYSLLSQAELESGKIKEAEDHARNAVALAEKAPGEKTLPLFNAHLQLFNVMIAKKDLQQAQSCIDQMKAAISKTNAILPMEIISGEKQAEALLNQASNKLQEAEKGLQEVLGSRQEKIGLAALPSIETLVLLGKLYELQNKNSKATGILKSAYDAKVKLLGESSPAMAELAMEIGELYDRAKNSSEAEKYFRQSLEMAEKSWGKDNVETLPYIDNLAKFLRKKNDISAAQVYEIEANQIRHPESVPKFVKH